MRSNSPQCRGPGTARTAFGADRIARAKLSASSVDAGGSNTRGWVATRMNPERTSSAMPSGSSAFTACCSQVRKRPCSGAASRKAYSRMLTSGSLIALHDVDEVGHGVQVHPGSNPATLQDRELHPCPSAWIMRKGGSERVLDDLGQRPARPGGQGLCLGEKVVLDAYPAP